MHSTLNSIGGIQVLFPLFAQLDLPSEDQTPAVGSSASSDNQGSDVSAASDNADQSSKATNNMNEVTTNTSLGNRDQSLWYKYIFTCTQRTYIKCRNFSDIQTSL